ncbi:MAG: hypothetical protein Barrevirus19_10 [Barrevirus sp.]|uniref:F-box domain-containing protein n=1 Tax=Barrevirus sp. TaxID=2487763 RepID=A0A3G4ZQR4_9VIRU|nr:MAG: hypothetical protein Barrevirus19_10 [Barrevirus sp.]
MFDIINKFQFESYSNGCIKTHIINQQFLHQQEKLNSYSGLSKIVIDISNELYNNNYLFEYAFVVLTTDVSDETKDSIISDTAITVQANGHDIGDSRDYLYFNRVYPVECMDSYDEETNDLLKDMSQEKVKNLLFVPFKFMKDGSLIDINNIFSTTIFSMYYQIPEKLGASFSKALTHLTFNIGAPKYSKVDFYIKLSTKETQLQESFYKSRLIEHNFLYASPDYGNQMSSVITRNGDLMSNIYIKLVRQPSTKFIKEYYKIINSICFEIKGNFIFTLPIDYIELYLKVMKNITLNGLQRYNTYFHYIIPVNIKDLTNIEFIPLCNLDFTEVRLKIFMDRNIESFNHVLEKHVELNNNYPKTESLINVIPKDILKLIMEYLDDKAFGNFMQSCRLIYSITPENQIIKRYEKYKIVKTDLSLYGASYNVMYHWPTLPNNAKNDIDEREREKNEKIKTFVNEYRTIEQHNINIIDTDFYQLSLRFSG